MPTTPTTPTVKDLGFPELGYLKALLHWPFDAIRILQADRSLAKVAEIDPSGDRSPMVDDVTGQVFVTRAVRREADRLGVVLEVPHEPLSKLDRLERILERTVLLSIDEIGNGELPGQNNIGPDIARYCAPHGDGWEWCAGFSGYNLERAHVAEGTLLPFNKSLGARTLAERIEKYGHSYTDPALVRRGDWAFYDRGVTGSRSGHIEIIEVPRLHPSGRQLIGTVPGNSNPKVCRKARDITLKQLRFNRFVSMRPEPRDEPFVLASEPTR